MPFAKGSAAAITRVLSGEKVSTSVPKIRLLSTQAHLLLLAIALVGPLLAFTGFIIYRYAEAERSRIEQNARDTVNSISVAIDRELVGLQYTLLALAEAPSMQQEDFETFHGYAARVAQARNATIVLRGPQSNQLMNTSTPYGGPVPGATTLQASDIEAARTGETVISNYFVGLQVQRPSFAVVTPIISNGQLRYFLSLSVGTSVIDEVIKNTDLNEGYIVAILDRRQTIMARSVNPEGFVGTPAQLQNNPTLGDSGIVESTNRQGVKLRVFYKRGELSGWVSLVSVPTSILDAPLHRSLQIILLIGVLFAAISLFGAWYAARSFSRPMSILARNASALTRNQDVMPVPTKVREIAFVSQTMMESADDLRERTRERDRAEAALQNLNGTLESLVAERTEALRQTNARLLGEIQLREESEERFRQLQKIEAIGQLTGGIAHDFNNMLAVILGSLRLMQRRLQRGETDVQKYIDGAVDGAERAAKLTTRLLAFARQQSLSPTMVDANKMISGMSELLRRTISENVRIETVLAGGLWRSHVDPSQLENAILNLAVNARDAMPEGGRLTIETSNADLDHRYASAHADVVPGQYVLIAVTDTGGGMTPEVIARAFDPFFTTKDMGHGTGLGLSQVHGFIKQSGGHVKIYSEIGEGTTIKLYLPRFVGDAEQGVEPQNSHIPVSKFNETVLVVEDEDTVRGVTVDMLTELGYRVLQAEGAMSGLKMLDAHPEVTLLFTDVVMPDVNGRKLADEAKKRRPDLRVLFTTGYTRNAIVHNGVLDAGVHLIVKPFTMEALAQKLEEIFRART
jgi:signal transduction histidine kinase/CheY-like chemotaxis protein